MQLKVASIDALSCHLIPFSIVPITCVYIDKDKNKQHYYKIKILAPQYQNLKQTPNFYFQSRTLLDLF